MQLPQILTSEESVGNPHLPQESIIHGKSFWQGVQRDIGPETELLHNTQDDLNIGAYAEKA